MKAYHLNSNEVPAYLKGNYKGHKFKVIITKTVSFYGTYWNGGSKNTYSAISLIDGNGKQLSSTAPQFGKCIDGENVNIKPGYAIIMHSIFCGKDSGLTFYIHPDNAPLLLKNENESDLTLTEQCMLLASRTLKSSYAGRKPRLDMMRVNGFTTDQAKAAIASLIDKKLLQKNGAITTKGRNHQLDENQFKRW